MAPVTVEELDAGLADAVDVVGRRLAALGAVDRAVTRRRFIDELADALGPAWELGDARDELQERQADLPSLTAPLLGPKLVRNDQLAGDAAQDTRVIALAEAGWAVGTSNFDHLLLDVLNIVEAYDRPGFVAGYLVAAAPARRWNEPDLCADWFAPTPGVVKRVSLLTYLVNHRSGWPELSNAVRRPVPPLPDCVEFCAVAAAPFRMREKIGGLKRCSVRCVRVVPTRDVSHDHALDRHH